MASQGNCLLLLLALHLLSSSRFPSCGAQPYIGVNYGEVADNLPPPEATARLLRSTTISKVRLYGADPSILRALAGTNISFIIGAANGDIPSLATDPAAATRWVAANVLPFVPASSISLVAVGNEVLESNDASLSAQLLPAMRNLRSALAAASSSSASSIKVSTVNTMAVLAQSDPPSSGAFHPDLLSPFQQILAFLQSTGAPFLINPYPYFAYQSDPRPETLAFCLFQPNAGRYDAGSQTTYTNMFDAQLDAVRAALAHAGFSGAQVVVAETGWPYRGGAGEAGATVDNARAYVGGLVAHLRAQARPVDTYIFALYDEDLKPGPESERSFGLFHPADMSMTYDAGLMAASPATAGPASRSAAAWCLPKDGVTDAALQANLDYACAQAGVDCGPIQPGGACYQPNTVRAHAAYAMNQLYQASGRNPWNCDFRQSAVLTSDNPSYGACEYTGGQ